MRICKLRRFNTFFIGSVQAPVTNVVHNRTRKQVGILQNNPQRAAQIRFLNLIHVDAIVTDFPIRNVIETVD